MSQHFATLCTLLALAALPLHVFAQAADRAGDFDVAFEKFTLGNGLDVVLHVDRSDPVVAVALAAHVGSAREKPGRTGFAHLFEHLLFLESENLGKGGLDAMSARIGGEGANGFTTRDQTNYFQTVPRNALEKMLWAEADKLGYFINTVTEPVLAKEKEVVKNEKRQGVDNRPYGHTQSVIDRALYPAGHPYSWQVIGSLEDLQAATLEDVKEFYRKYYVPNNVTLVVAGDFDPAEARKLVEHYFAEIPAGESIADAPKQSGRLDSTVRFAYEDNFATLPQLTRAWPTVEQYHPDAYALDVLADYLSDGRNAPLYQALVVDAGLAAEVSMYNYTSELAGQTMLEVQGFEGVDLDAVSAVVDSTLAAFRQNGIPAADLARIKAGQETSFYNGLSSVLGKAFQLAQYNTFADDPGYASEEIGRILAVTPEDVLRAYNTYLAERPHVATSFVPEDGLALATEGSTPAAVEIERVVAGAEVDPSAEASYERTPSSFDRTAEPDYDAEPLETSVPTIDRLSFENGLEVVSITGEEVPLVDFDLRIDGGQLLEDTSALGAANFLAELLNRGTARRTPAELEAALESLGASVRVSSGRDALHVRGNTLARNFDSTLAIVAEMILEPRWDPAELELVRKQVDGELVARRAEPNAIAAQAFGELLYGEDDPRAREARGTGASVAAMTMDALRDFYRSNVSPRAATLHVVGAVDTSGIRAALVRLGSEWEGPAVPLPELPAPSAPDSASVYFFDVPDAKQSVIRVGYPALAATDARYYPAEVSNYILGGGGFASRLTQELREAKGYTYGIGSGFAGSRAVGPFAVSTGVRSDVTLEAARAIKAILADYPSTFSAADLATTRSSLIKGNARAFETAGAKLAMLGEITEYGYPDDYVEVREATVQDLTLDGVRALAGELIEPDKMVWLVVGDAATQLERMRELGYGEPVLLNPEGPAVRP